MNRIKPYLQLIRLPNLFTAAADSLAGWLIVSGTLVEPGRWVPLVLASVLIYLAGIVLNDVFDFEVDLKERPGRPLPSGKVSRTLAAWVGGGALILGPILALGSGSLTSFFVALALATCVLGYDAGLKKTVLGPEVMGACRGLNLLLGMSQSPNLGGPYGWLAAFSLGLFIVGVTWISRSEVETGKTRGLYAGFLIEELAIVGLMAASILLRKGLASVTGAVTMPWEGLACLLLVTIFVSGATLRAISRPEPGLIQKAVKTGVFSLVWLDVALVASARGPLEAAAVAVLWIPAFLIGKWLYTT